MGCGWWCLALGTVYPAITLQISIVQLIRHSLDFANWKVRKALAAVLKPIYTAANPEAAEAELTAFEQSPWGQKFSTVVACWRRARSHVIPFLRFRQQYGARSTPPIPLRVCMRVCAIIKTRGHFPSDEAAIKLIWPALRNIPADWSPAAHDWKEAMNQFALLYADRFTTARG
jgi:putative transposase